MHNRNGTHERRERARRALCLLYGALALGDLALDLHGEVRVEPRDERLVRGGREKHVLAVRTAEVRLVDCAEDQAARATERRVRREGVIARCGWPFIRGP